MNLSDYHIFFDDGGVMNDNRKRGPQWERLVGEYFADRFGGDPIVWGGANHRFIVEHLAKYETWTGLYDGQDYAPYNRLFIDAWVEGMFNNAGRELPPRSQYDDIFYLSSEYVTPRVHSSFPGVVDTIKVLYNEGFTLHTASGESSADLHGYLSGMGVRDCFTQLYGPDLIDTLKTSERYYLEILKDLDINPEQTIFIDDDPRILAILNKMGFHAIQSCQPNEHPPCTKYYLTKMTELPTLIRNIIE